MEFSLEAKIKDPINIAIPISKILNVTSSLKKEDLEFSISEGLRIKITTQFGEYNIVGVSSEDFLEPEIISIPVECDEYDQNSSKIKVKPKADLKALGF